MSVRDRGYDPRTPNPRSGAPPLGGPTSGPVSAGFGLPSSRQRGPRAKLLVSVGTVIVVALVALGFSGGLHFGVATSPASSPGASWAAGVLGGSSATATSGGLAGSPDASGGASAG